MTARFSVALVLSMAFASSALARSLEAPKPKPRPAGTPGVGTALLRGAPEIQPGKQIGFYVWTDDTGLHVRWSADGTPILFAGSLKLDKKAGALVRTNLTAGGWVELQDNDVLFSSTANGELDGFDLALPAGAGVGLEVEIDAKAADLNLINLGAKLAHPPKLPIRFRI